MLQVLQDNGWSLMTNLANAQEHVPEAEHNNHILKEHTCTTYHGFLQDAPTNHYLLHGDGNCSKVKLLSHQEWLL